MKGQNCIEIILILYTSAGLFHMNKLICKTHDIRMLLLAYISHEM